MTVQKNLWLAAAVLIAGAGCGGHDLGGNELERIGRSEQALEPVPPGTRPLITGLSAADRLALSNAILVYITQDVLDEHVSGGWHQSSEIFFSGHHGFLSQLEAHLSSNGLARFVPLPKWDPSTPIPAEFLRSDPIVGSIANQPMNAVINVPLPPRLADLCGAANADQLAADVNGWHGSVHIAVGGTMSLAAVSPGAAVFWPWHAYVDDIYHDYQWYCGVLPAVLATRAL